MFIEEPLNNKPKYKIEKPIIKTCSQNICRA